MKKTETKTLDIDMSKMLLTEETFGELLAEETNYSATKNLMLSTPKVAWSLVSNALRSVSAGSRKLKIVRAAQDSTLVEVAKGDSELDAYVLDTARKLSIVSMSLVDDTPDNQLRIAINKAMDELDSKEIQEVMKEGRDTLRELRDNGDRKTKFIHIQADILKIPRQKKD